MAQVGDLPRRPDGTYELVPCLQAYIKFLRRNLAKEIRIDRREHARARLDEMQLRRDLGKLMTPAEVLNVAVEIFTKVSEDVDAQSSVFYATASKAFDPMQSRVLTHAAFRPVKLHARQWITNIRSVCGALPALLCDGERLRIVIEQMDADMLADRQADEAAREQLPQETAQP
jgi:hypothetical protein